MHTSLRIKTTALSLVAAIALSVAAPVIVAAAEQNGPATDHSTNVSNGEVKQALQYTPGVLSASDQSVTTADSDSAMVAVTAGATVDVPRDASEGITLAANGAPSLDIELPNADAAADAKQIAPGVVAYSASNGSANAVQADENGGVRMLTIIDNPKAPTTYDYKVTVPKGGRIELAEGGGAIVLDNNGQPISTVGAPWAKDAHGKQIRTWFTTDGQTLTQHVKHRVKGIVYPVTADPWWNPLSWSWRSIPRVAARTWNDRNARRNFLISAGCSLAAASAIAAMYTGLGAPVGVAVFVGVTSYGGCQILTRQ